MVGGRHNGRLPATTSPNKGRPMTDKIWGRIAARAIRLLLLAVLGLIALAVVVLTVIPRATHGTALTVLTGSMTPAIPVGSVVVDRPVDTGTLHVGDIATYQVAPGKAEYITHRIIHIDASKTPAMFTFKGDANRGADIAPVPATAIRGKVWFHVPHLGAFRDALHTRGGISGVAIVLLFGYVLIQLAGARRDKIADGTTANVLTRLHESQCLHGVVIATLPTASLGPLASEIRERVGAGLIVASDEHSVTVLLPDDGPRGGQTSSLLRSLNATSVATATFEQVSDDRVTSIDDRVTSIDVLRQRMVSSHV